MNRFLTFFLLIFAPLSSLAQQIPTAPNLRNAEGKRVGDWVITYSKSWKETALKDSIAFYRVIKFDDAGKPVGKTIDYYLGGEKQCEGTFFDFEPKEVRTGLITWYNENGSVNKKAYFENGNEIKFKEFNKKINELDKKGNYKEAIKLAEIYITAGKLTKGEEDETIGLSLSHLGRLYQGYGQYDKSERAYKEALEIYKKVLEPGHPYYVMGLNNLGQLYESQWSYAIATKFHLEALAICKKYLWHDHPYYANSLSYLADLYELQGDFSKAEPLYLESLEISKEIFGQRDPEYAINLNDSGLLYSHQGKYSKAEAFFLEAIDIHKKGDGFGNLNYATILYNLASLYMSQGVYSKAEDLYLEALSIRKKKLGPEHLGYAKILSNLGFLYESLKDFKKSEDFYLEALIIYKKVLRPEHPDYANGLINLCLLYESQGSFDKVKPFYFEANTLNKSNLFNYFEIASESQQKVFWQKNGRNFEFVYSLTKNHKEFEMLSFNNTLFTKGIRISSFKNFQKYLANTKDSVIKNNYTLYLSLKRNLGMQLTQPYLKQINITELESQIEILEIENLSRSKELRDFKNSFNIDYNAVKSSLKSKQVAIEFIDHRYYNGQKWTDTTIYSALLLRPEWKEPKMVRLFEKRELDELLGKNIPREALANTLYRGGGKIPDVSVKSSQELYKLVWQPLDSLLQGVKTIYYSPSGLLHQLNLSAIPINGSLTLGEKYNMYRLGSTRQLAEENDFKTVSNRSLLMGDINFDADSVSITATNKNLKRDINYKDELRVDDNNRGGKWDPLINTGPEIDAILKYTVQSGTLRHNRATEEAFYAGLTKKPKFVHLATHGFFYDAPNDTLSIKRNEPVFVNLQDAMLRSGLILAGGNRVWTGGKPIKGQEDGILTAYEVSLTDMRNTELVVTSACETALGDINGSEGVFGLQRAFKIAGAKNLLMSLWKVDDKATKDYMETFYRLYLKEGKSIHNAYQITQNAMKKKYKDPYYWAAFILLE